MSDMAAPRAHLGARPRVLLGAAAVVVGLTLAPSPVRAAEPEETTALQAAAPPPAKAGTFWDRVRFGLVAHFYSGTDRIRSSAANLVQFPNVTLDATTLALEPRVGADGRVSLSPLLGNPDPEANSSQFAVLDELLEESTSR